MGISHLDGTYNNEGTYNKPSNEEIIDKLNEIIDWIQEMEARV